MDSTAPGSTIPAIHLDICLACGNGTVAIYALGVKNCGSGTCPHCPGKTERVGPPLSTFS